MATADHQTDIRIICSDGAELCGNLFKPENSADKTRVGIVIICGALGVPQTFYRPFARYLANHGFATMTFDYRGIGESARNLKGKSIEFLDWGRLDIEATLQHAQKLGKAPIFQIGHSCGGQLLGLAPSSAKLNGAIFVAATLAKSSLYPTPQRYGLDLMWNCIVPLICLGRDRFPGRRLGFSSIDVPSGVMRQWAELARSDNYIFSSDSGVKTENYQTVTCPLLSLSFDDDSYASKAAVDALTTRYSNIHREDRHYRKSELNIGNIGHFGLFREKAEASLWQDCLNWFSAQQVAGN